MPRMDRQGAIAAMVQSEEAVDPMPARVGAREETAPGDGRHRWQRRPQRLRDPRLHKPPERRKLTLPGPRTDEVEGGAVYPNHEQTGGPHREPPLCGPPMAYLLWTHGSHMGSFAGTACTGDNNGGDADTPRPLPDVTRLAE